MPFRNGIQFDLGNVYLCNPDGDVVGEFSNMKFADMQEFDDTCYTEAPESEVYGKVDYNKEISFSCRYEPTMLISRMWKILYGWKAKGPVRKRVLGRLWGLRM